MKGCRATPSSGQFALGFVKSRTRYSSHENCVQHYDLIAFTPEAIENLKEKAFCNQNELANFTTNARCDGLSQDGCPLPSTASKTSDDFSSLKKADKEIFYSEKLTEVDFIPS